jgi:hypothetical protein
METDKPICYFEHIDFLILNSLALDGHPLRQKMGDGGAKEWEVPETKTLLSPPQSPCSLLDYLRL